MTELDLEQLLYDALVRVVPYSDHLPPTAADQVRIAIRAFELKQARRAIVQTPATAAAAVPQQLVADARDPDQVGEQS